METIKVSNLDSKQQYKSHRRLRNTQVARF